MSYFQIQAEAKYLEIFETEFFRSYLDESRSVSRFIKFTVGTIYSLVDDNNMTFYNALPELLTELGIVAETEIQTR